MAGEGGSAQAEAPIGIDWASILCWGGKVSPGRREKKGKKDSESFRLNGGSRAMKWMQVDSSKSSGRWQTWKTQVSSKSKRRRRRNNKEKKKKKSEKISRRRRMNPIGALCPLYYSIICFRWFVGSFVRVLYTGLRSALTHSQVTHFSFYFDFFFCSVCSSSRSGRRTQDKT